MICPSCGRFFVGKLGQRCPTCEARQAARRIPVLAPVLDDEAARPAPEPREHRLLPGGNTGRLRECLKFFGLDGW